MSLTSPIKSSGIVAARAFNSSWLTPRNMSVMIIPGAIALTRTPCLANSRAKARVKPMIPDLEAQ